MMPTPRQRITPPTILLVVHAIVLFGGLYFALVLL